MSEISELGHELAWEVRRLAGFGSTNWIGYKVKPYGLIGVEFQSEYNQVDGAPVLKSLEDNENIVASIIVESGYRSVIATGDLLCDREPYQIHADGYIEATLTKGELSESMDVDCANKNEDDDEESGTDMSAVIFGLGRLSIKTSLQEANDRRLDQLSDLARSLSEKDPLLEKVQKQIDKIEDSGEQQIKMPFRFSVDSLTELLARLKLIEERDKLGIISNGSIVNNDLSESE